MSDLAMYLEHFVDPTLDDFGRNPTSVRHAFLACVAACHAIDRGPKSTGNLRKEWCSKSWEFLVVDMVAHHFKHVKSDIEKAPTPPGYIPLSCLVFEIDNAVSNAGQQMDVRNLYFIVQDAVKFLHEQANDQT
jgi:hypothetical protein